MTRWSPFAVIQTVAALVVLVASPGASLQAHTSLPAYLELTEISTGSFSVVWRVPAAEGPPPAMAPAFPDHCAIAGPSSQVVALASVVVQGVLVCDPPGLVGQRIEIDGLRATIIDAMVRIAFVDGTRVTRVVRPVQPGFVVSVGGRSRADALGYFRLGVDHILSGIDHLLFVFGLLLVAGGVRRLLKAITAFTVAHSITLALAALGLVRVRPAPIEAVIALSIMCLAVELAQHQRGITGLSYRQPGLVAFTFGLLHGFGFAGTLSEVGLPPGDIPRALLFFNVGVEAGQLGFIAVCFVGLAAAKTLERRLPAWAPAVPVYVIGTSGCYWFLERCLMVFTS